VTQKREEQKSEPEKKKETEYLNRQSSRGSSVCICVFSVSAYVTLLVFSQGSTGKGSVTGNSGSSYNTKSLRSSPKMKELLQNFAEANHLPLPSKVEVTNGKPPTQFGYQATCPTPKCKNRILCCTTVVTTVVGQEEVYRLRRAGCSSCRKYVKPDDADVAKLSIQPSQIKTLKPDEEPDDDD
jgi:hypothetical protein